VSVLTAALNQMARSATTRPRVASDCNRADVRLEHRAGDMEIRMRSRTQRVGARCTSRSQLWTYQRRRLLARLQFAFTVSFHIIFPAISIGFASYLAALEGLWMRTGQAVYRNCFLLVEDFRRRLRDGVVSGVVMSYEFGRQLGRFSRVAGAVSGPLLRTRYDRLFPLKLAS